MNIKSELNAKAFSKRGPPPRGGVWLNFDPHKHFLPLNNGLVNPQLIPNINQQTQGPKSQTGQGENMPPFPPTHPPHPNQHDWLKFPQHPSAPKGQANALLLCLSTPYETSIHLQAHKYPGQHISMFPSHSGPD